MDKSEIVEVELVRLKRIAKSNGVSLNQVIERFNEEYSKLPEGDNKADNGQHLATSAVMNQYRKEKAFVKMKGQRTKAEVTLIQGFITGDKGVWDKAEVVRRQAKSYADKNGHQAAVEAQYITEDGQILDRREKLFGKPNPDYLKPLDPKLHVKERTLFGFFRIDGNGPFKYGSIQTNNNRLAEGWSSVKKYTPAQVPAIIKENGPDDIKLSSSMAEDTTSVFQGLKETWNIKEIIDETLAKQWTLLTREDVERFHENFKDAWDRRIFVKGIVCWISENTKGYTRKIGLMNMDNEDEVITVELPESVPINFGELSELYVFGSTKRSRHYDETHTLVDGDVNIIANGIFVVQDSGITRGPETLDEAPIEGWLD